MKKIDLYELFLNAALLALLLLVGVLIQFKWGVFVHAQESPLIGSPGNPVGPIEHPAPPVVIEPAPPIGEPTTPPEVAPIPIPLPAPELCVHPDGQFYRDHWLACKDTVDLLNAIVTACSDNVTAWSARALLCETLLPPRVDNTCGTFEDGAFGGKLYKPRSDNFPHRVVFLRERQAPASVTARIEDAAGNLISEAPFAGRNNGDRNHYRPPFLCGDLPSNLVVRFSDGVCLNVPDPCVRYD